MGKHQTVSMRRLRTAVAAIVLVVAVMTPAFRADASSVVDVSTEPDVVQIAAMIRTRDAIEIPEGSRIVIADIRSEDLGCATAVRQALTHRLAENLRYEVLTRDNLPLLVRELDAGWEGRFDTGTVRDLGKLLGASYFVFAEVAYCGRSAADSPDNELGFELNIIVFLQVVNTETGRIVLATSSEGVYVPRENPSWPFRDSPDDPIPVVNPGETEKRKPTAMERVGKGIETAGQVTSRLKRITNVLPGRGRGRNKTVDEGLDVADTVDMLARALGNEQGPGAAYLPVVMEPQDGTEPRRYQILRAAEDMAARFADRFFRRTMWQTLEMWRDDDWVFGQSVRLVQLGQCAAAVELMGGRAATEQANMSDAAVGRYLHNYGVALMCANQTERALGKLQTAYQVGYNKTTLRMIGATTRMMEWALEVQSNQEVELQGLLQRASLR